MNPTRGHEQAGRRPVLILNHDVFNARWKIESANLPKPTWAKISQIRTFSVERIGNRLASFPGAEFSKVIEGLNEILGE